MGSLNMILATSEKMIKENPERVKMIVETHKKATDYVMAHPEDMVEVAMQKLGQQRAVDRKRGAERRATPGSSTTTCMSRPRPMPSMMLELKQIRAGCPTWRAPSTRTVHVAAMSVSDHATDRLPDSSETQSRHDGRRRRVAAQTAQRLETLRAPSSLGAGFPDPADL